MSTKDDHINYMKNFLIPNTVKNFNNKTLINYNIKSSEGLDGFMSALYRIHLLVKDDKTNKENFYNLIVKFMKEDISFRETSKSYIQFSNEIYIYSNVIPYYEKLINESKSSIKVEQWIPYVYLAKYGIIEGLGDGLSPESILALEDLKPKGYRCGPRLCLDRKHLFLMIKPLSEYHSLSYIMKINNDKKFDQFLNDIIPLPWSTTDKKESNLYFVLYKVAFKRFFLYYDKQFNNNDNDNDNDKKFKNNIEKLRKYCDDPTKLLEKFREYDKIFSVILHGDYNRNNVLFQYDNENTYDNPKDIKMIDFQELRVGTPAIDLSFFMYMNIDPKIRDNIWMELLNYYHEIMYNSLLEILDVDMNSEKLKPYSFENFYEHFTKYGLYGALVCMHFLPWMYGTEEECERLGYLFATDMYSEEFDELSIKAGGDYVNEIIMEILKHANRMGYMDKIL